MSASSGMGSEGMTLVLGATGKTGRRVVERLGARGVAVRIGSRRGKPPFDWSDRSTWEAVLRGVRAVYIVYTPDLAVPGASDDVRAFAGLAVRAGVRRLVLLSGRGEPEAERSEEAVRDSGVEWTILRSSWFSQNFSESFLVEPLVRGRLELPVGNVGEPFIDADDIADVAVAALTEDGHAGRLYELTGPRLLTFAEAVDEIARATGRQIDFVSITRDAYRDGLAAQGVPSEYVMLLDYLFAEVMDGRNARLGDGVQRALGREPRDFADFVRVAAGTGVWSAGAAVSP